MDPSASPRFSPSRRFRMSPLEKARQLRETRTARLRDVRYYSLMMFATPFSAIAFCRQIARIVARREAKSHGSGAQRPIVWIACTGVGDGSCYVYASDGALDAAWAAGLDTPVIGSALDSELPPSRCLVLGDPTSDAGVDRKTGSASLLALCLAAMTRQNAGHAKACPAPGAGDGERAEVF